MYIRMAVASTRSMKYSLANMKKEMHTTHLQLMQLAISSLTSLFAALIAIDGTSRDSGPSGCGKTTCGDDEDVP